MDTQAPQIWKHNDRVRDTVMDAYDGFIDRMRILAVYKSLKKSIPPISFQQINSELSKLQAVGEASYTFKDKELEYLERYVYFDEMIVQGLKVLYEGLPRSEVTYRRIVNDNDRFEALRKIRLFVVKDVKASKLYKIRAEVDDRPISVKSAAEQKL